MATLTFFLFLLAASPPWVTDPVEAANVEYHLFHSNAVGGDVSYHIYLPDAYEDEPDRRFPVLYWLHGSTTSAPVTAGIPSLRTWFHQRMSQGDIPPMLIVFPNGLPFGMYCDSKDGRQPVESMLMDDLLPHIDENFRTTGLAEGRFVEGWSMGGYGAARLGLKYHDRFRGFSMLGAGPMQLDFLEDVPLLVPLQMRKEIFETVFGSDTTYFEEQSPWRIAESVAGEIIPGTPIRQAIGMDDPVLENNRAFHFHMADLGIDHAYFEIRDAAHEPLKVIQQLFEADPGFYHALFADATGNRDEGEAPSGMRLYQNYPNPFNPSTKISFELPEASHVRLEVYDVSGRRVANLRNGWMPAGRHSVTWNAAGLASGFYVCRLISGSHTARVRMVLAR